MNVLCSRLIQREQPAVYKRKVFARFIDRVLNFKVVDVVKKHITSLTQERTHRFDIPQHATISVIPVHKDKIKRRPEQFMSFRHRLWGSETKERNSVCEGCEVVRGNLRGRVDADEPPTSYRVQSRTDDHRRAPLRRANFQDGGRP
jgi:hypothetical protein